MLSVCILGSTGSVGTQAIEVARSLRLRVSGLSTWSNVRLLAEQAREFRPKACAVGDRRMAGNARSLLGELSPTPELFVGTDGLSELASWRSTESCSMRWWGSGRISDSCVNRRRA